MDFSPSPIDVTNLSYGTSKDSLLAYFKRFGSIRQVVFRASKHSALIHFSTEASASAAIHEANYDTMSASFPIQIKRAFGAPHFSSQFLPCCPQLSSLKSPNAPSTPPFPPNGEVDSIELLRTRSGQSLGIA
jgi:RNA recognition motif-containing protein